MRVMTCARTIALACLLVPGLGCCIGPAQRIELSKSGDCPTTKEGCGVTVEGFFVPEKGFPTQGGWEDAHPYARIVFSAEQGVKSKFDAALFMANHGANGPEKASRIVPGSGSSPPFHIYDNRGNEVGLSDRVRISGQIRDCIVKVDKIEKL